MKRPCMTHYMVEPWYCPLPMQSVISGGRVFKVFGDRSSAKPQEPLINKLLCMNAFNGTVLWERDLSAGFMVHRNTLIATPDTLYLGDDKSCKLMDAATGMIRDEIVIIWKNFDKDLIDAVGVSKGAQHWLLGFASTAYLKVSDDALFFAGPNRPLLVAASAKDGKLLWKKDCSVKGGNFPTEGGNVQL